MIWAGGWTKGEFKNGKARPNWTTWHEVRRLDFCFVGKGGAEGRTLNLTHTGHRVSITRLHPQKNLIGGL